MPVLPLLLIAFVTAAVVGLYLLRPPPIEVVVPSTLLWRRLLEERGRRSDLLRWILSLLLALAISLTMALALTGSALSRWGASSRGLVIVIDNSTSMATRTADGHSRLERARRLAQRLLAGRRGEALVADTCGELPATFAPLRAARRRLDRLEVCLGQPATFPLLSPGTDAIFISDGVAPLEPPAPVRTLSVLEPADNVGFTRIETRPLPGAPHRSAVYFELRNASTRSREIELEIEVGGESRQATLRLGPDASLRRALELDRLGDSLQLTVRTAGDAFPFDDRIEIPLPAAPPYRVGLATPGNRPLETLLELDPRVELTRLRPEDVVGDSTGDADREPSATAGADASQPEILILDRTAPGRPPLLPCLLLAPAAAPWLPEAGERVLDPEALEAAPEHAVLAGLSLADLQVRSSRVTATGGYRLLLGSRDAPLLLAWERPPRRLWLNFDLADSNLPQRPEFPVLIRNALAWLRRSPEVRSVPIGPLVLAAPAASTRVELADGSPVAVTPWGEDRLLLDLERPGVYRMLVEGEVRQILTAHLIGPAATAVNRSRFADRQGEGRVASGPLRGLAEPGPLPGLAEPGPLPGLAEPGPLPGLAEPGPLPGLAEPAPVPGGLDAARGETLPDWHLLLMLAIGLALVEWWTYHRRFTV